MIQAIEAVVDADGRVRLLSEIRIPGARRAIVTVLDEPATIPGETALLSESALQDWLRPEEDAAWLHLQSRRSD
jgi:hypothetical protein